MVVVGILMCLFTIEIMMRLSKNAKRVQDPEIDSIDNLHNIKHWMPPGEIQCLMLWRLKKNA